MLLSWQVHAHGCMQAPHCSAPAHRLPPPVPAQMFERESSREKNLEKNAKEAKAKARKEAARTGEPLDRITDDDLRQVGQGEWRRGLSRGARGWPSQLVDGVALLLDACCPI